MRDLTGHGSVWAVARRQHGVITHAQLVALGYSAKAIKHRIARRRLHPLHRGVYAVGRAELTQKGKWMAALLACGDGAALSYDSAAALWRLTKPTEPIHVSVLSRSRSREGIVVHRRTELSATRHPSHDPRADPHRPRANLGPLKARAGHRRGRPQPHHHPESAPDSSNESRQIGSRAE